MKTKMSLTRLLNEIKLAESKIVNNTVLPFVTTMQGSKLPTGYQSKEQLNQYLSSNYQSVSDLIKRRNHLKSILVATNATTVVKVAGEEMTIAQAIERKRTIDLDKRLLAGLNSQFNKATAEVENHNARVEQNIDQQLLTLYGKDRKVTQEEVDAISAPYRAQHQSSVVDPLGSREEIKRLNNFIQQFESEVDFVLSEANAQTLVEV